MALNRMSYLVFRRRRAASNVTPNDMARLIQHCAEDPDIMVERIADASITRREYWLAVRAVLRFFIPPKNGDS